MATTFMPRNDTLIDNACAAAARIVRGSTGLPVTGHGPELLAGMPGVAAGADGEWHLAGVRLADAREDGCDGFPEVGGELVRELELHAMRYAMRNGIDMTAEGFHLDLIDVLVLSDGHASARYIEDVDKGTGEHVDKQAEEEMNRGLRRIAEEGGEMPEGLIKSDGGSIAFTGRFS